MSRTDATPAFAVEPLGESMLLLRFGSTIDAAINRRVHAAARTIGAAQLPGVVDIVPAYASLALVYEPAVWVDGDSAAPWRHLAEALRAVFAAPPAQQRSVEAATLEIPVCYGSAHGPDLAAVASHCGLDETGVAARHAAGDYHVAMLGFTPGFPYLLGLDATLATPRRSDPRVRVPAGSVAIGGAQTAIYPGESPGGWQLIGATPLRLFDAERDPPCLLAPGDRVRFRGIDGDEFTAIASQRA